MSPWLRRLLRAPRHLYRHRLGWLLGHRFLQLSHQGRRTGRQHHTVLEVVRYDRATGEATVVSGFGARSDWFRNLQAGSEAVVSIGRSRAPARYRIVDADEATDVIADYERRAGLARPVVRAALSRLLGWPYDGSDDARRRLAVELPMVAFRPAHH